MTQKRKTESTTTEDRHNVPTIEPNSNGVTELADPEKKKARFGLGQLPTNRTNSPKQTEASRRNGSKSKGPTSDRGKAQSKLNALTDGLFSKDIVLEIVGEKTEDFERLRKAVWEFYAPTNIVQEMFVADYVENWWRRQRARRAAAAELKNRLRLFAFRDKLRRADAVDSLKARLISVLKQYTIELSSQPARDTREIAAELEETRIQLAATSSGVDFLIRSLKSVESEPEKKGQLSLESMALLIACGGLGNETVRGCIAINAAMVKQADTAKAPAQAPPFQSASGVESDTVRVARELHKLINKRDAAPADQGTPQPPDGASPESGVNDANSRIDPRVLSLAIGRLIRQLKTRQQILASGERWDADAKLVGSVVPEGADRFLRSETTAERRMYRALAMLLGTREVL